MASVYASFPANAGGGVPTYTNFAAFPSAVTAGNGALAIALDTNILYESNGTSWVAIGSPGAALSVGTFDSGTPSANGAHIDTNALIMQSASGTNPGLVNVSTQTLAGVKTFSSAPNLSSLTASLPLQLDASKNVTSAAINLSGTQATGTLAAARFPALTGDVTTTAGSLATSLVATTNSTLTTLSALVSVGTITTGVWNGTTIAIANGGTGQTSAANAFGALSPLTTKGDLLAFSTVNGRLPVGSNTQVLTADSTQTFGIKWAAAGTGTVTSVAMTVPTFLSVSGTPITTSGTLGVTLSGTALPVANGGTGDTTLASNGVLYGNGTGAISALAVNATATKEFLTQSSSAAPAWATIAAADVPAATTSAQGAIQIKVPTQQIFTSSSGTYTTPAGVAYIRVRMVGGGGGGAGGGTGASGTLPTAGGNSTFGTTLLAANGGGRGVTGDKADAGGSASLGTGPVGIALSGGNGSGAGAVTAGASNNGSAGGMGGVSPFGGAGAGGVITEAGVAAVTNSGSGGGGGGGGTAASPNFGGSGGSAGGFIDAIIGTPSATYAYAVGAAGSAGGAGAGTGGTTGGAGGSGYIVVEEHYY